jgi:UDP-N-acetylmuramoyl-tripeptide--D-alanyl-D-alanine ligase
MAPSDERVVVAGDAESLWPILKPRMPDHAVVLLKGSRGMRLERLLPLLREFAGAPTPAGAAPDHP